MINRHRVLQALIGAMLVLAIAHAWGYLSSSSSNLRSTGEDMVTILQTPVSAITPRLLAERQPIVIEDRLVDPGRLAVTAFGWQYLYARGPSSVQPDAQHCSRARFTLLYFSPNDAAVDGERRTDNYRHYVTVQRWSSVVSTQGAGGGVAVLLKPGRVIVLPPHWTYISAEHGLLRLELHDAASAVLSPLMRPTDKTVKTRP